MLKFTFIAMKSMILLRPTMFLTATVRPKRSGPSILLYNTPLNYFRENMFVCCDAFGNNLIFKVIGSGTGLTKLYVPDPPANTWFHATFTWDVISQVSSGFLDGVYKGSITAPGGGPVLQSTGTYQQYVILIEEMLIDQHRDQYQKNLEVSIWH